MVSNPHTRLDAQNTGNDYFLGILQDLPGDTHGISVEHINNTAINLRFPAREDGYIAIDSSSERSVHSVYQIPGDTTVYQVPLSENISCLSLFPRHKDNGILLSNTPVSLLITNERSTTAASATTSITIIGAVVVSVNLVIIGIISFCIIYFIYKCMDCIIIIWTNDHYH